MTPYAWEWVIAMSYVGAGPVAWGLFAFAAIKGRSRMNLLAEPVPLPQPAPSATILIPVKDEEQRIADSVNSALNQDYPDFHVIAIDDRSVDRTGAILDDLAAKNTRLTVIHLKNGDLPDGWTGKCNALHRSVTQARQVAAVRRFGCDPRAGCLAQNALARRSKADDLVSLLPHMEAHTFWEGLLIPLCCALGTRCI